MLDSKEHIHVHVQVFKGICYLGASLLLDRVEVYAKADSVLYK